MKKTVINTIFIVSTVIFSLCALLCIINTDVFKQQLFQQTTSFSGPAMAKFEKDGNIYVIDSGSFRLVCMSPYGDIRYTITIDKFREYTRIVDAVIDEAGNLYVYALEAEYDAQLTKRDIIRQYDNRGRFVKEILSISYNDISQNPRLYYQFGSFRCANGIVSFSQVQKDTVTLYQYDVYKDDLRQSVFNRHLSGSGWDDYYVAQLVQKDFNNFAYVLRDGDIYEVVNGGEPVLRASFNWSMEDGGVIPWFIQYDAAGSIVFYDMASGNLCRLDGDNMQRIVAERYFDELTLLGERAGLSGFGFYSDVYAGVYGGTVWMYDGGKFTAFRDEIRLPLTERLRIIFVQLSVVLAALALVAGIITLYAGILNRHISLFIKQTAVIIPLLVIAFIILFSVTFNKMLERLNETVFNEMHAIAVVSSKLIDGDDIASLKTIKDFHRDEYKRLTNVLKEITGNNENQWDKGFYAALFTGGNFEYGVTISNNTINLFRPAGLLEGDDYYTFMSGKPIGGIFSLDDGDWAFALSPVYNKAGEIKGLLEIGFDMTAYEISNVKLQRDIVLIVSAVCLLILLVLSLLISIIVRQLSAVARVLKSIAGGDHTKRVTYRAKDELGMVSNGLNYMADELQNQFERITRLNESTIRFVPVQFMEHLGVSDISSMKLGDNVQREISVLFFDIRAFSVNSEMMTARENFLFINKILGIAGPILRKHNGFVDKFIGDAAMALFDNGRDAVRAGIELYRSLVLNKNTRVKIGVDGIKIGVGIHTGYVMMGIVGENERLSSTVISANVNLASRVESLSKQTGSGMLITRDTLNQLSGCEGEFKYRFVGLARPAGVNEVVGLFDMLDALPEKERKYRLATKAVFESGVRKFHSKDYVAATMRFEKVVKADPTDVCAMNHLIEARKRLTEPGLPSVFIFDKK